MNLETGLAFLVFFPFGAGLLAYGAGRACRGGKLRDGIVTVSVAVEFAVTVLMLCLCSGGPGVFLDIPEVCGLGLHFVLEGFRLLYGCVAAFLWMMTAVFSGEYFGHLHHRSRFYLFLLWTQGAVMGVFLSGDLYTTFIFFEIMSFTSYVWVAQEENAAALKAASTYLAVAVAGGLVMLMGFSCCTISWARWHWETCRGLRRRVGRRRCCTWPGRVCSLVLGQKPGRFPCISGCPKLILWLRLLPLGFCPAF